MNKLPVALLLVYSFAVAQPTQYQELFTSDSPYSIAAGKAERYIGTLDGQLKGFGFKVSPFNGYVVSGAAGASRIDYAGRGGTAVGLFGIAEGTGAPGIRNEVVGVYGMAWKSGPYWATGLHGECILKNGEEDSDGSEDTGGTCIGVNIELIGNNVQSTMIGLNVQPRSGAHNVVGLQFQNAASYKHSIDFNNTYIKLGYTDAVEFCMRYVSERQAIEFWRNCGTPGATRHGWINMNWGTPDVQLNQ